MATLLDFCRPKIVGCPPEKKEWDYAIVLQGRYTPEWTEKSIHTFLQKNAELNILIIVSVFESDLTRSTISAKKWDSDKVVYLVIPEPSRELFKEFWANNCVNQNLQRLSSGIGIKFAESLGIPLCLKIRSDAFFAKFNSCKYLYDECMKNFPVVQNPGKPHRHVNLKGRIVIADHARRNWHVDGHHFICDHWLFGFTEDLMKFFEIEKGKTVWDEGRGIKGYGFAETNLTQVWMKDLGIEPFSSGILELSARFMAIAGMVELEFFCQKHWDYKESQRRGKPFLEQIFRHYYGGLTDFVLRDQWLSLVKRIQENPSQSLP